MAGFPNAFTADKTLTSLPEISTKMAQELKKIIPDKARALLGIFLLFSKEKRPFLLWFSHMTGKPNDMECGKECYKFLREWCNESL